MRTSIRMTQNASVNGLYVVILTPLRSNVCSAIFRADPICVSRAG